MVVYGSDSLSTARSVTKGLVSTLARAKGALGKRVLPVITSRRSVVAEHAVVLDGRTLQLHLYRRHAHADLVACTVLFVRDGSKERHRVPAHIANGHLQMAVALDHSGLNLPVGSSWSVLLETHGRTESIAFLPDGSRRSPVVRNPPSPADAITRSAVMSRTGGLLVRVSRPQECVHVDSVATGLGRITVKSRAFLPTADEPVGVRYVARGLGIGHTQTVVTSPGDHAATDVFWQVPTAELARLAVEAHVSDDCVWDLHVVTAHGSHSPQKALGDLKNPRLTFRYATVTDVTTPRRDRFRPYWTVGGKLAIEHWFSPRP